MTDAQTYIQQWKALALLAGVLAGLGATAGLYGTARAWGTLRAVRRRGKGRTLVYVSLGDVALLAGMSAAALVQVATSAALVWLAGRYPAALADVLVTLDGSVTVAYVLFVVQVALVNLAAPTYLAIRALALLEEEWKVSAP